MITVTISEESKLVVDKESSWTQQKELLSKKIVFSNPMEWRAYIAERW
jgi:hypothetical protein